MSKVTKAEMVEILELEVSVLFNDPDAKQRALEVYRAILAAIEKLPADDNGQLFEPAKYRVFSIGLGHGVKEWQIFDLESLQNMQNSDEEIFLFATREAAEQAASKGGE